MDFAFSEEQQMLRDQARSMLKSKLPPERVAELADSDTYFDENVHKELAGLGWIGLSSPEDAGGAGMSFLDEAVLFEELGYALYPGPYFSTVGLALPALERSPELLEQVAAGEATATLAWAEEGGPRVSSIASADSISCEITDGKLTGRKVLVADGAIVTDFVVTARGPDGLGLYRVQRDAAEVKETSTMDPTRRYAEIYLKDAPAEELATGDDADSLLERIRVRALSAAALEAVGIAQRAVELATEYVKERKQFDRPIGVYQAVSHQVANMYVDTELARSLAYWAAWATSEEEGAAVAAATAKGFATEAAVTACERCIQVHGGIGFTWEHIAHRLYKRAQWLEAFEGHPSIQRARVAAAILD